MFILNLIIISAGLYLLGGVLVLAPWIWILGDNYDKVMKRIPLLRDFHEGGKYEDYTQIFYMPVLALAGAFVLFFVYLLGWIGRATSPMVPISIIVFISYLLYKSYKKNNLIDIN